MSTTAADTNLIPEMRTSALPILAMAVLPMTYSCREYRSSSRPAAAAAAVSSPEAAVAPPRPLLLLLLSSAASLPPSPPPTPKEPSALLQPPRSARHGRANPENPAAASCPVDVGRTTCPVAPRRSSGGGCVCRLPAARFRPWTIHPAEASAEPTCRATSSSRTPVLLRRFMSFAAAVQRVSGAAKNAAEWGWGLRQC